MHCVCGSFSFFLSFFRFFLYVVGVSYFPSVSSSLWLSLNFIPFSSIFLNKRVLFTPWKRFAWKQSAWYVSPKPWDVLFRCLMCCHFNNCGVSYFTGGKQALFFIIHYTTDWGICKGQAIFRSELHFFRERRSWNVEQWLCKGICSCMKANYFLDKKYLVATFFSAGEWCGHGFVLRSNFSNRSPTLLITLFCTMYQGLVIFAPFFY